MARVVTVAFGVALVLGGVFTTPALPAGSDVVHYPTIEAYRVGTIERHYQTGVPVPRVRAFDKASWVPCAMSRSP